MVGEIGKNDLKLLIRRSVKGNRTPDLRLTLKLDLSMKKKDEFRAQFCV